MNFTILRYDVIGSTNTEAANQARLGADEGLCVIARRQTEGRGRHGRTWVSEKDAGLYFSVVLRPDLKPERLPLITLMAGVSVCDALVELGLKPDIKWVNDVLVANKKMSGILAETVETPTGLAVVVGIGINLVSDNFPVDIVEIATSVKKETGKLVTPDEMAEVLTRYVSYFYEILCSDNGPSEILHHWRQRSTYFAGKHVRVTVANHTFEGLTDGLEKNGALRVKTADGSLRLVQAGDVQRLRSNEAHQH